MLTTLSFDSSLHTQLGSPNSLNNWSEFDLSGVPLRNLFGAPAITEKPDEAGGPTAEPGDSLQAVDSYLVVPDTAYGLVIARSGGGNEERQKGAPGNWVIYLGTGK